ncbi:hypothetical protein [Brevibacillus laterosporus]|uniref:Uncharacterized protein n=1 Tax=Brevibacillus laterosporus TaxID=1465 RepID=A0AAP8QHV0_BRELA|nr:hypothetical protein [Brevibacillus laterosporus]MBG9776199.1 hypothetical protein [Brevibacillus laterosporus]PPB12833.1 hypothetical protein C4A77_00165 [Brevibacillus laterosporus]
MNTNELIKLRTMAGLPTPLDAFTVFPFTLREIVQYGYDKHNQHLHILTLDISSLLSPQDFSRLSPHFSLYDLALVDTNYLTLFVGALLYFLREKEIHYDSELGFVFGDISDSKIISKDNFVELIEIIKIQNNYHSIEENDYKPANSGAEKIKQILLAGRKRVQEVKSRSNAIQEESLSLLDLISITSANANGISIFNVFDMNMVQFNDQFNRMKLLEDYQVNIQALMHGADSKSIELKHWMTKIK